MRDINLVKKRADQNNWCDFGLLKLQCIATATFLVIKAVLICTGTIITVYGKSGRAVQVSSSDAVVLSADRQGATAFELVVCLASDTSAVSEAIYNVQLVSP